MTRAGRAVARHGWRLSAVFGLLCTWLLFMPSAQADPVQDAQTLACLSPARVDDVVQAAVTLNLATAAPKPGEVTEHGGQPVAISRWLKDDPADFHRVCAAITTPATASQSSSAAKDSGGFPFQGILTSFGSAFSGALVGSGVAALNGATARRRELSVQVETTGLEFRQTVDAYLDARRGPLSELPAKAALVGRARNEAVMVLGRVAAKYPGWDRPTTLRERLTGDQLGLNLVEGWPQDQARRDARITQLRSQLDQVSDDFVAVATGALHLSGRYRTAQPAAH